MRSGMSEKELWTTHLKILRNWTRQSLLNQERALSKTVLICPQCGSKNVTYWLGLKAGVKYQCKDCGYVGAFVIEG